MNPLKKTELHVHLLQCLHPKDIFDLGKDVYQDINWNRFNFLARFENIYGYKIDPIAIFEEVIATGSLRSLEDVMIYKYSERGDFDRFNIKSHFPTMCHGFLFRPRRF
jgi:hypothetical protein